MLLNIEVTLTGSFLSSKSITLRALVLDDCPLTKISRRLAHRLGLTEFRRVFVNDINSGNIIEEEISVFPISIHCQEGLPQEMVARVCPIVRASPPDFFWDMTIGNNISRKYPAILEAAARITSRTGMYPTPGPGFNPRNSCCTGTLIGFTSYYNIPINNNHNDVFFEFCCTKSSAISRLALNKHVRQLIVIYEDAYESDGPTIYRYAGLPTYVEQRLEDALFGNDSLGAVMQLVRDTCTFSIIPDFPTNTILVNFTTMRDL